MTVMDLPSSALTVRALNAILSGPVSRTVMLPELSTLLAALPVDAAPGDYRVVVVDDNISQKPSREARSKTFHCLRDRYAHDPQVPLFRALRLLLDADPAMPISDDDLE